MGKNNFIQKTLKEYTLQGDNQAIMRLVMAHESMPEFLLEAAKVIREKFGSKELIFLSAEETENLEKPYLFARVLTGLPVMEALAIVDQIDNNWLIDNLDRVQGRFNFDVIFAEDLIKFFIRQIEVEYPKVRLECLYDNLEEQWYIWNTDINLQYDRVFQEYVGKLIRTLFYDRGVFNIAFGYKAVHIE